MNNFLNKLQEKAHQIMVSRNPDVVIRTLAEEPYLSRWWVIPRNRWFNVYLHLFEHSDDDRALHDHPWVNMSLLLKGCYCEVVPGTTKHREQGHYYLRWPTSAHRVMLYPHTDGGLQPVWTLFITGPNVRQWGFLCPKGWKHWRDFTGQGSSALGGEVGPSVGCGED